MQEPTSGIGINGNLNSGHQLGSTCSRNYVLKLNCWKIRRMLMGLLCLSLVASTHG